MSDAFAAHTTVTTHEASSTVLGVDALKSWAYRCVDGLTERCDEINELNVFPIPDSDTGTNLMFTVRAAVESMRAVGPDEPVTTVANALARGAVAGARGNSGVIVSQLMRAVAEGASRGILDAKGLQWVLSRASALVMKVVSVPVEGTIVTVLERAAAAAASDGDTIDELADVVGRATGAASTALDRTRSQLPILEAAGVVDAGALGLVVMLDALSSVITGDTATLPRYHRQVVTTVSRPRPVGTVRHEAQPVVGYEVVYRVTGTSEHLVDELRGFLSELGDSVVVAGDGSGTWTAHVHTANPGLAVEVALAVGRLHGVRISAFTGGGPCEENTNQPVSHQAAGRDVLAVVAGDGAERLFVEEGAAVLRCDISAIGTSELCAAIIGSEHSEVLVLPNGALSAQELVSVSIASRTAGKDVLMLPSASMVQGLAALAVHEPTRAAVDDAFAMSEAAAGTRWASLRVADVRSLTWVGTCEPGDGLGLVGHEVVVIGGDVISAGRALLDQLLSAGGEMVTVLRGLGDVADTTGRLVEYISLRHPGVEVVVYNGGQPGDVMQFGVE
ncbi:DAK2 domain-containing protein [Rhodococcus sp. G-MC3]|uniref:DAK2 domain-containing protein n=1 Tax=Rhodococcus sp. G-MC3 TaxID=3046209 RepID=UPI0024BB0DDE|nr:DAK2 domain-containing protein [Rhodococcus sp. G-MC3]MDJ0391954.1 DAK2 domain-containing protein [Rhodococcus sp. G-MC3]